MENSDSSISNLSNKNHLIFDKPLSEIKKLMNN